MNRELFIANMIKGMKDFMSFYGLLSVLLLVSACGGECRFDRMRMDLSGYWSFCLDSTAVFSDSLYLPGTTDTNKKGILNTRMDDTEKLSRIYTFKGKAWYQKTVEIPASWEGQNITLFMERTKPSHVYVDGCLVGSSLDISTPQIYDLSRWLDPGRHVITLLIDNGNVLPGPVMYGSHACVESTQTNWNGIIGDFYLEATDKCHIKSVDVYPDYAARKVDVKVRISGCDAISSDIQILCSGQTWNTETKQKLKQKRFKIAPEDSICKFTLDLGKNAVLWSEFHPALYRLCIRMKSGRMEDVREVSFGLRDFSVRGKHFTINDHVTFLRGKHDACVFPLTGHTPMNLESWRHYFQVAKKYGINHCRFHSWCPPEACFKAADIEGVYLQPELPFWGGVSAKDSNSFLGNFLTQEGRNIQKFYSNHASFVMFALGNEIGGEQQAIAALLDRIRKTERRHLYAFGSNNFLGMKDYQPGADYLTTCRIGGNCEGYLKTNVRASFAFRTVQEGGCMNSIYPNTSMNFDTALLQSPVPVIGHEIGQYQVYPCYEEMKKYTGVLEPRNFAIFKKRLENAGMGDQAHDFLMASGKWAAELYRAEMEMNFRTADMGGFQLLDLQDYPGQGTALVGVLDAFMDSKGLITPEEWRRSCCEVVPLFECASYTHFADSVLHGQVKVANYSEKALSGRLNWVLKRASGEILNQGIFELDIMQGDLGTAGTLHIPLSKIVKAEKCILSLSIEGTSYMNDYPVWVYPSKINTEPAADILVADRLDMRTISVLKKGGKVLLFPDRKSVEDLTVGGLFITDFWNYRMFNMGKTRHARPKSKISPGTMGLLMDPHHPLFKNFPTEFHSNWQWFPIVKESSPMILDELPVSYRPIIQVIDNIERNHRLGLVYEFNVDGGKLLVCMSDLDSQYKECPEVKQFKAALLRYMESEDFKPTFQISNGEAVDLFKP